jgi:DNA-directed RNA polymerase subunit L
MKIDITEETKTKIRFFLPEMDHTFSNILVDTLYSISGVEIAAYSIDHPLTGKPEFIIKTKDIAPKEALKAACEKIKENFSKFKKELANVK